jgi:hypothetical protein
VIGEAADVVNAGIYAAEGDWVNAGLSLGAAIPVYGTAFTAAKYARLAAKYGDEGFAAGRVVARALNSESGALVPRRGASDLARRAAEFASVWGPRERNHRTIAVLRTDAGDIVASSYGKLSSQQRAMLRAGEIPVPSGARIHAEKKALAFALDADMQPRALGASRIICAEVCAPRIHEAGGSITSSFTAVWP